jgi:hypothetical protein
MTHLTFRYKGSTRTLVLNSFVSDHEVFRTGNIFHDGDRSTNGTTIFTGLSLIEAHNSDSTIGILFDETPYSTRDHGISITVDDTNKIGRPVCVHDTNRGEVDRTDTTDEALIVVIISGFFQGFSTSGTPLIVFKIVVMSVVDNVQI